MAAVVLVDNSVWIHLMRTGQDPVRELVSRPELSIWPPAAWSGWKCFAVWSGVRSGEAIEAFMNVVIDAPTDHRIWESATEDA